MSICFFIEIIFLFTASFEIISLSLVGLGSPILPVAPPHNSIGWCPALANLFAVHSAE